MAEPVTGPYGALSQSLGLLGDGVRRRPRLLLAAVLLFAAYVRFVHLDWDGGHGFHPDERAMAFAVERISFRELRLHPGMFQYGSAPLYAARALVDAVEVLGGGERADFATVIRCGRALSAAAGVLTVFLTFLVGRRLRDASAGLLAAFLLACAPLHVQASHFMAVDVALTCAVLLALAGCLRVVALGRPLDFALAGAAAGLAFATKASAAPLLAPLAVAVALQPTRGARAAVRGAGIVAAALAATVALAEPYALLDASTLWRHVAEQGRMVRAAGTLPYTLQYVGTPHYAYELLQLLWGLGPPLAVAALAGTGWAFRRLLPAADAAQFVLASWVIPFVLVTGAFEVRFPRYLLPIYPLLALWAALWLVREAGGRFRRVAMVTVAAGSLLCCLAFLTIYRAGHPAVRASRWFHDHAAPGSKLLTAHWEEGFPLALPGGGDPRRFTIVELPYYEPDSPAKTASLAKQLASADYLALPTRRAYGAIARLPERFPSTEAYFRLLFAGDLGYRLAHVSAARPRLFGLELRDELLDESLTVYDHPRVLVFANVGRLDAGELGRRLHAGVPSRQVSRAAMLGAGDAVAGPTAAAPLRSTLQALVRFAFLAQGLGLAAWVLLRRWLPAEGGYAVAKVLGPVLLAYPAWLLASVGIGLSRALLVALLLAILVAAAYRHARGPARPLLLRQTEMVFWTAWAAFLALRALDPAVFWGEKPMDLAILHALMRAETLPPPDPWFAGSPLHYTYFGHFVVAMLARLTNLHPGIAFNLGISLFGALTATAAFAAGSRLAGSARVGLLSTALAMAGNVAGPLVLADRGRFDFDAFWATSRVIPDTINEYPLWSFTFADLHAHALALPFGLAFLTLALDLARRPADGRVGRLVLLAATLGAVAVTSGWSAPTWALLLPFLLLATLDRGAGAAATLRRVGVEVAAPSLAVALGAWLAFAPFWRGFQPPERRFGLERGTLVHAGQYWLIFGLFLVVLLPWLWQAWAGAGASPVRRRVAAGAVALAAGLTLPPVREAAVAVLQPGIAERLGSVRAALVVLAIVAGRVALRQAAAPASRAAAALAAYAFLMTAGCDVVFVWDRMNTVFKYYLDAWLLLAVASAFALAGLWRAWVWSAATRRLWCGALATHAAAAMTTALLCAVAPPLLQRVPTPRPTLDGAAYLERHLREEAVAIDWLARTARDLPVVAEAAGPAYREFTRVAMHTGLPVPLGWEYHLEQRGIPRARVEERRAAVERLFTSRDRSEVADVLRELGVAFVFAGELERRTYGDDLVARLGGWADLLTPVHRSGGVTVFAVAGAPLRGVRLAAVPPPPDGPSSLATLRQPRAVAVGADGGRYVADFDNHRIVRFSPGLTPTAAWGRKGEGRGELTQPCDLVSDAERLLVADTWNHRVQAFAVDGTPLAAWAHGFFGPRGIAVAPDGDVFVADTGHHRVVRLGSGGDMRAAWGEPGSAPGELREPTGLAVDAAGRVAVCDNGNGRLQLFTADGALTGGFPVPGWRAEALSEPKVAIGSDGTFWVTVPLADAVRQYTPEGRLLRQITRSTRGPLDHPLGIAYDPARSELLVTELAGRLVAIPVQPEGGRR